jgi:hypothetical protein
MTMETMSAVRSGTARVARSNVVASLAAVAIFVTTLAGCTAASGDAQGERASASAQQAAAQETSSAESCSTFVSMTTSYDEAEGPPPLASWSLDGKLQDLGSREYAEGTVEIDETGTIVSYTVAPGDVEAVIRERLCAGFGLGSMNHVRTIQPGQVLRLTLDPETPWIPYFSPTDAPEGFSDIPYQQTMESMGRAVDAGDIDLARTIWNDELSAMFFNQAEIDSVTAALDASDLDALRQMFS